MERSLRERRATPARDGGGGEVIDHMSAVDVDIHGGGVGEQTRAIMEIFAFFIGNELVAGGSYATVM